MVKPAGLPLDPAAARLAEERSVRRNLEEIRSRLSGVKVVYSDVDGTLMGPGGCFILNASRSYTLGPAGTLVRALERGVDIFLVSGRSRTGLLETARILGLSNYVAELGAETVYDLGREVVRDYGVFQGVTEDLLGHIESMGVLDFLYRTFPGKVEPHEPWSRQRECVPLLRGLLDVEEVNREFARRFPGLVLVDNGIIPRTYPGLQVEEVRAYHVVPQGVSKENAVGADMRRRGLRREETAAVGDAEADIPFAREVGVFFLVRNGLHASPQTAGLLQEHDNAFITEGMLNEGWAEAVEACLAAGREG
jgi:hydroxymethylpyrimidine pyrophosphatase-like HAD family hydrolase